MPCQLYKKDNMFLEDIYNYFLHCLELIKEDYNN